MEPDAQITKVLLTWPGLTSWQSKSSPNIWSLHPKTFFRQKRHNEESLSWLRKKSYRVILLLCMGEWNGTPKKMQVAGVTCKH